METIFAPWRMAYIGGMKPEPCVFCAPRHPEDLVVFMGRTAFVMLNRYPYTCGHLLVIPVRHVRNLAELTAAEKMEMFSLVEMSIDVLSVEMKPDGFNVGMNLGRAAGAGIEDHLHMHVVPRWSGDTNFMSVVGDIRVIPEDIIKTGERLEPHFQQYHPEV
jgi:ATP adenylyltransferase